MDGNATQFTPAKRAINRVSENSKKRTLRNLYKSL